MKSTALLILATVLNAPFGNCWGPWNKPLQNNWMLFDKLSGAGNDCVLTNGWDVNKKLVGPKRAPQFQITFIHFDARLFVIDLESPGWNTRKQYPVKFSFPDGRTVDFEANGNGTGKLTTASDANFFALARAMSKEPRMKIEVGGVNLGDFPLDGSPDAFARLFSCIDDVSNETAPGTGPG